jgi:hypothetical protein
VLLQSHHRSVDFSYEDKKLKAAVHVADLILAELGRKLAFEGGHAASETNDRLFWEACIAHGY